MEETAMAALLGYGAIAYVIGYMLYLRIKVTGSSPTYRCAAAEYDTCHIILREKRIRMEPPKATLRSI